MKWDQGHQSPDVVDRRGEDGGGRPAMGGLIGILPFLLRSRFGWVGILLVVAFAVFGGGLSRIFPGGGQGVQGNARSGQTAPRGESQQVEFISFVLDDAQASWQGYFAQHGLPPYKKAKLVLFTGATQTGCGYGEAATGPFYCPADERVYIDLSFYKELASRFGAAGDFAQAYVLAHEIGHHVQDLLGTSDRVHKAPRSAQEGEGGLSVRLELQADCFAGIWARSTQQRGLLEAGDIDEALTAAAAVGDDRLQRQATGTVHPESWTHGSSTQRSRWFKRGNEAGTIESCDTFGASAL